MVRSMYTPFKPRNRIEPRSGVNRPNRRRNDVHRKTRHVPVHEGMTCTSRGRHCAVLMTTNEQYTQNVKKLVCAVPIPSGETQHRGPHVHDVQSVKPFHYCTARFVLRCSTSPELMLSCEGVRPVDTFATCHTVSSTSSIRTVIGDRGPPIGHTQREHETAHGSMSHTEWGANSVGRHECRCSLVHAALEGDADASVELSGHTFGQRDR